MGYTRLNEREIQRLVNRITEDSHEEELDEIFGGTALGDAYQGVRGFFKGESYGYYKYLSKIKNRSKKVISELEDIENFVNQLVDLKPKVERLTIAPEKKLRLLKLLDYVIKKWEPFFPQYNQAIREINKLTSEKLSGERMDVIVGSGQDQIGKDLMKSKDIAPKMSNQPQEIDFEDEDEEDDDEISKPIDTDSSKTSIVEPAKEKTTPPRRRPVETNWASGGEKSTGGSSKVSSGDKKTDITNPLTTQGSIEPSKEEKEKKKKEDQKKKSEELSKALQGNTLAEEIQRFKTLIK